MLRIFPFAPLRSTIPVTSGAFFLFSSASTASISSSISKHKSRLPGNGWAAAGKNSAGRVCIFIFCEPNRKEKRPFVSFDKNRIQWRNPLALAGTPNACKLTSGNPFLRAGFHLKIAICYVGISHRVESTNGLQYSPFVFRSAPPIVRQSQNGWRGPKLLSVSSPIGSPDPSGAVDAGGAVVSSGAVVSLGAVPSVAVPPPVAVELPPAVAVDPEVEDEGASVDLDEPSLTVQEASASRQQAVSATIRSRDRTRFIRSLRMSECRGATPDPRRSNDTIITDLRAKRNPFQKKCVFWLKRRPLRRTKRRRSASVRCRASAVCLSGRRGAGSCRTDPRRTRRNGARTEQGT